MYKRQALWEVTDGSWSDYYESDAGYIVTVRFDAPQRCYLMLTNSATEGEGHRLTMSMRTDHRIWWTLVRP